MRQGGSGGLVAVPCSCVVIYFLPAFFCRCYAPSCFFWSNLETLERGMLVHPLRGPSRIFLSVGEGLREVGGK